MIVTGKQLADSKPTVYYGTMTELEFQFDRDLPAGTEFTLSLDTDKLPVTPPIALAKAFASGRSLVFSLDSFNTLFERAAAHHAEAFVEISGGGEVFLQDAIPIAPRVDVEGVPPAPQDRYPTFGQMNDAIRVAVGLAVDDILEGANNE